MACTPPRLHLVSERGLTFTRTGGEFVVVPMSERENREIEAVHACGHTPVVFIGGLRLLPGNWASRAG